MLGPSREKAEKEAQEKNEIRRFLEGEPLPSLGAKFEMIEKTLSEARDEYLIDLLLYMQSFRERKAKFARVMRDFKTDKHMPFPDEPKELTETRAVYVGAKKREKQAMHDSGVDLETIVAYERSEQKIFLDKFSERFTVLENEISDSSLLLWKKDEERAKNISLTLMGVDTLETIEKEEPPQPPEEHLLKRIEEVPVEISSHPPSNLGELPQEEKKKFGLFVFPLEFNNKELLVGKGHLDGSNDNIIRIIFNNVEIASGELTVAGPKVELNKVFKHGFMMDPTEEERAFARAMELVSRLKFTELAVG
jgi:hypothetical protein